MAIAAQAQVMYLLDTNVISELRRPRPHSGVTAWLSGIGSDQIFISAVTLGELQAGVENARQQDTGRAESIESWIDGVAASHNILPMDGGTFRCWARLMHAKPADLIADAMIAATAVVHNLTVVTRNLRDFERLGVPTFSPFR
jgi:predicted nucleic acid-binding protein